MTRLARAAIARDILQDRFTLLDLDEREAFDPLEVVRKVRMVSMWRLLVAVRCRSHEAPLVGAGLVLLIRKS